MQLVESGNKTLFEKLGDQSAKVTVCINLCNSERYVVETLNSIHAQTLEAIDIIILDNCSNDASATKARVWLERNQTRFNNLWLLQNSQRSGLAAARNTLISLAETPYLFVLDAGDQLYPRCLERCLETLQFSDAAFAYTLVEKFDQAVDVANNLIWNRSLLSAEAYITSLVLLRRSKVISIGGYSKTRTPGLEDDHLWHKLADQEQTGILVPEILARYRVYSGTANRKLSTLGTYVGASSANPFNAGILDISTGGTLRGWAVYSSNPGQSLKIQIAIDGRAIATVDAKTQLKDSSSCGIVDPVKEFEVTLPFTLNQKLLLDGKEHVLKLTPLNSGDNRLKPLTIRCVLPKKGFGRIESCANNLIRGWALPDGHTGSAKLDVYVNATFYAAIQANLFREDLLKNGIGHGKYGFEVRLPAALLEQQIQVEIRFSGTQIRLQSKEDAITPTENELAKFKEKQVNQFSRLAREISRREAAKNVTIIVPIFNAYDEVHACIRSLIEQTSAAARLFLINDASTDERMASLLTWAETYSNVSVFTNETNLGYTKTINLGIKLAGKDDVVLLNSDTSVGPRWLQNLQIAAYHDVDIATVTAVSDNAGAFSVPAIGQANDLPAWLDPAEAVRTISQNSYGLYPEVPTGSGFCMYIRRAVFETIGLFDEVAFSRGYGEENDFCMRALHAGWRNIIDDRTLVRHVRSASFRGEKQALIAAGRQIVNQRYPEYGNLIRAFFESPELHGMRYAARRVIEGKTQPPERKVLPRVLYVISTQTGGTPQTNQDLMNGLGDRYQTMLLHCDSKVVSLYDTSCHPYQLCEQHSLEIPVTPFPHRSTEYDKIVAGILIRYSIELLHIRHIAWHSLSLPQIAKRLGIPVVFSFHDFYTICPTINLLDENKVFCGGRCTKTAGDCQQLLWKVDFPTLKHESIKTWQHLFNETFQHVDAFVTTADSAKVQMEAIYPDLKQARFEVIPHGRDFQPLGQSDDAPLLTDPEQPLRILFTGNIGVHKGAELIIQLYQLDRDKRLEFHFLGHTAGILRSIGVHHGAYQRSEYAKLVQQINPRYVGIFSIWPETYCHTLTESWATGVPVIAIDKGAVGDRIRMHGGGWLLDTTEPVEIYAQLLQIAEDSQGHTEKVEAVKQWQKNYQRQNSIATMSAKYHELYQQVLAEARPFKTDKLSLGSIRLGVFVKRDPHQRAYPSGHIRVLEWLNHAAAGKSLDFQFLDTDAFIQDDFDVLDVDAVLVQRNAIDPEFVEPFIAACDRRCIPIIFELDDDLTRVPGDKDLQGIYERAASSIEALVKQATAVVVSTPPLAKRMQTLNPNITLIPNTISEFSWLRPLKPIDRETSRILEKQADGLRVLYMGNSTHAEDLALVQPVFEELSKNGYPIKLFVVGGEPEKDAVTRGWYQYLPIPVERRQYPEFVDWFRAVATHFDIAIAPLVETEFNQCKSELKYLQYSAIGLPTLCSHCPPYRNVVEPGVDGILVENTADAWKRALIDAAADRDRMQEIGQAARAKILEKHLMSHHIDAYLAIFRDCLNRAKLKKLTELSV